MNPTTATGPAVAVVMPTQGRRTSLGAALQSVRDQTWTDFELVVVDDSPRGGPSLVEREKWGEHLADVRVRVIPWRRGEGCAAAKQAGLSATRAPWVAYLDDDNLMRPDRLERSMALAHDTPGSVVLGGFEVAVAGRRRRRQHRETEFVGDDRLLRAVADTNVLLHRRASGVSWDIDLTTGDDAVFFHRLVATQPNLPVPNVASPLVVYQVHGGPRANADATAIAEGDLRLQTILPTLYGQEACEIIASRMAVTQEKFRTGNWRAFGRGVRRLLRAGGRQEARMVLNAALFKFAPTRRWVVR